jgi:hypothetical protein
MLTFLDIILGALVVLVIIILVLLLAINGATYARVAVFAVKFVLAVITVIALLLSTILLSCVALAALNPVESAIVLVTIEFARAVVRKHFSDVDFRFTLKMHDAIICLVVHIQEDVHITEQR